MPKHGGVMCDTLREARVEEGGKLSTLWRDAAVMRGDHQDEGGGSL